MKTFKFLAIVLFSAFCALSLTSCNKDKEITEDITYQYGITQFEGSVLDEIGLINNGFAETFKRELGVEFLGDNLFTFRSVKHNEGDYAEWDAKVKTACEKAKTTLSQTGYQSKICFTVTNVSSNKEIWQWKINME